tara:strand:- start:124161 stop:124295 length:135 start_codon:yes stop_codon:yes gene_type:complete
MATVVAAPASHFEILIIQTLPENRVLKGGFHRGSGLGVSDRLMH